jgi:hypothetical protein
MDNLVKAAKAIYDERVAELDNLIQKELIFKIYTIIYDPDNVYVDGRITNKTVVTVATYLPTQSVQDYCNKLFEDEIKHKKVWFSCSKHQNSTMYSPNRYEIVFTFDRDYLLQQLPTSFPASC